MLIMYRYLSLTYIKIEYISRRRRRRRLRRLQDMYNNVTTSVGSFLNRRYVSTAPRSADEICV